MEDKIRKHIDSIFEETTPSRKAYELKEEMIQNLEDKYKDLISEGKSPESAYNIVIAGIGDISGLLNELEDEQKSNPWKKYETEAARKKSAMLTAIAVMLYILSVLPLIIFDSISTRAADTIGLPSMFVMWAIATGLLVYNSMTKPKYIKESDTMVEEFREWKDKSSDKRKMRKAISTALWTLIIALYFVLSFTTHAWHMTWILFLLGFAAEAFINIFTDYK